MRLQNPLLRRAVIVLLAVLAGGSVTVAITGGGDGGGATIVIRVDSADPDTRPDRTITVPAPAVQQLEQQTQGDLAGPLAQPADQPETTGLPLAAQSFPGCRTAFVRNQSSRNGARPQLIVWHYTVSPDRPGWDDNNALTAMANNPATRVSWHFSIGRQDGNCAFNVPLSMKAWTQTDANQVSVGIEVIATGKEASYVEGAGKQRLIQVTREIGKELGIPMRQGQVDGCRVVRSGIVTHQMLGACGGGHVDIHPFTDYQALVRAARGPRITGQDRVDCRYVRQTRQAHKHGRKVTRHGWRLHRQRLDRLKRHGLTCKHGTPART